MRKKVIVVEGLIGSGKTTLTRELAAALGPSTLALVEPDEKGGANPYLGRYYADAPRWALTMQVHLLAARYRMHLRAQWHALEGAGHAVVDRSYYGDTAFARLQVRLGSMSTDEFATYSRLYQAMTASVLLPSALVRVLATPEACAARIARRMEDETGRRCEAAVDLEYLRGLEVEIDRVVSALRDSGVVVLDVPWDAERDSPGLRAATVAALASRLDALEPADRFLDVHGRIA